MTPEDFMEKARSILLSKAEDYTSGDTTRYENFERSSHLMSWFSDDQDKAFVSLIGTKLARLGSLLSKKKKPNNESIEDSFMDLINYCALWAGNRSQRASHTHDIQLHPTVDSLLGHRD